ncbi:MAG: hypothetical protein J1F29_00730, partial [Lentimicrobiaceae bacterium]|nr:hypothetical protein [Lentimicrobiaceae bacterium]
VRESFGNAFTNVRDTVTNTVSNVRESFGNAFTNVRDTVTNTVSNVRESFGNAFTNTESMSDGFGGLQREQETSVFTDNGVMQLQPATLEQKKHERLAALQFAKFCDKMEIILPQGTPQEHVDILLNELMRRINDAVE